MDCSTSKIGFTMTLQHESGCLNEEYFSVPSPLRHTVDQRLSFLFPASQRIKNVCTAGFPA